MPKAQRLSGTVRVSPRRLADLLLPVAFFASVIFVLALTDWRGRSDQALERQEQRRAAVLPPVPRSVAALYHYPAEFSHFMDDHYGLRGLAINARARLVFWLLGDSFAPDIMVGRDHWLFFTGNRELRDTLHTDPLSAASVSTWAAGIEARRRWLAARGIKYVFVLAPDKRSVYPEYLPRLLRPGPGPTRRGQLDDALADQPAFLDLTAALRADKAEGRLYYRWDTHWNRLGGYDGYRAVMHRLGLTPEPMALGHALVAVDRVGDLGRLAGLELSEHDLGPRSTCARTLPPSADPALFSNPFDESQPVYEDASTTCATGTGRLLMFHDSFAGMWEPWLSTQFARAVYVWRPPSFEEMKRMVEIEHPTVVIEERVERFLIWPFRP